MIIVKNISGFSQDISDLGFSLNAGESRILFTDEIDYEYTIQEIQNSVDLETGIINNLFILNDGEKDLTKIESLEIIGTVDRKTVGNLIAEKTADIRRNTMTLAIELEAVKHQETNNISFFVDSFENADEVDETSTNYILSDGNIRRKNDPPFNVSDTSDVQFNQGTYTNTEVIENKIRKLQVVPGATNVVEDFEDDSNLYYQVKNRIYFTDFEDQDLSSWTLDPKLDRNTGISSINIVGNYGLRIDGNDRAYSPVFDCSGKTGIKVKLYLAGVSLDNANEQLVVGWYDGSTWQTIHAVGNSFNGYVTLDIPDAWLASNNQLVFDLTNNATLFGGTNAGNDSGYVDDVEIYYITNEPVELVNSPYFVNSGSYSGKFSVDFSKETNEFYIDLSPAINMSLDKYLKIRMFKPERGIYKYKITLIDSSNAEWNTGALEFPSNNWFTHQIQLSGVTGIDKTAIAKIKVSLEETIGDSVLWDKTYQTTGTTFDTFSIEDVNAYQSFSVDETITVGRLEIAVRRTAYPPRVPFYIAIANVFGTTMAIARFDGNQVPAANVIAYIIADFDAPITLYPGNTYKLLFFTTEDTWDYYWQTKLTSNNYYPEGDFYFNDWVNPNDLVFRLFSPKVKESIYIDNITREAESTYSATGSFVSRAFDLYTAPSAINLLSYIKTGTADTIAKYVRFAATEAGLSSAAWVNVTSDIYTGIPLGRWFQYRLDFSGTVTDSDYISNVVMTYSGNAAETATIIGKQITAESQPNTFIFTVNDEVSGTISYYISRNNGVNWQYIDRSQFNKLIEFNSNSGFGVNIKLKAVITGESKIFGWALSVDKEIIG